MTTYLTLGKWNNAGLPLYLESDESIDPALIERINKTLPEYKPVPKYNPQYLTNTQSKNIIIDYSNNYRVSLDTKFVNLSMILDVDSDDIITNLSGTPTLFPEVKELNVKEFSKGSNINSKELYLLLTFADGYLEIFYDHYIWSSGELKVQEEISPLLAKGEDVSVELTATFITEGAGYLNVFGYYVYPLQSGYTVPTKYVDGKYVPMTYEDRNDLKKVLVFPNASFPPQGQMSAGKRVKLLYDPDHPEQTFPNHTGIGFFLISNGWNRTVNTKINPIHTDKIFNDNNTEQTLIFSNLQGSTSTTGELILAFEDILLPGGDADFNDLVIKLNYTPSYVYNTDDMLLLLTVNDVSSSRMKADSTGLYLQLTEKDFNDLFALKEDEIEFVHTVAPIDEVKTKFFQDIFEELEFENDASLVVDKNKLTVRYRVPRVNLKNYIYLVKAAKNKTKKSKLEPEVNNIVYFQDWYIHNIYNIDSQTVTFSNKSIDGTPDVSLMSDPLSMGDPHITTVYGDKYMLPMDTQVYELYNDDELQIYTKLDYYPDNQDNPVYKDLTFMKYLLIKKDNQSLLWDLFDPNFTPDRFLKLIPEEEYTNGIWNHRDKMVRGVEGLYQIKYYELESRLHGGLTLGVLHVPHLRDYINSVSLVYQKSLLNVARGAFINRDAYKVYRDLC